MTVGALGATASKHSVISSNAAEIVAYCARYCMRNIVKVVKGCGFKFIYSDADSIFITPRWKRRTTACPSSR